MSLKRTPLRKVSAKRQRELKVYSKLRAEFMESRPVCEVCESRPSKDVHHTKGRLGGNYLNVSTFKAVCRYCHLWIHAHPSLAREKGLLQ